MNSRKFLLSFILGLLCFTAVSQSFKEKIAIADVFYGPKGEYAYIFSEEPSKKMYKWHIDNSSVEAEWEPDVKDVEIFFVGEDIYLWQHGTKVLKLNPSSDQFEVHYQSNKDASDFKVLSINGKGDILTVDIQGLVSRSNLSWGPLLLIDPLTGNETTIETTVSGTVHWYTPSVQPVFKNHIIYVDYAKRSFDKMKLKLYDISTGKSSMLMKKVKFGNYILHGFEDIFVFEYHSKKDDASRYVIYDKSGDEVMRIDWSVYRSVQFDYVKKELYFLKNDRSEIDVISAKTVKKVRTVPSFDDFFLRSSDDLLSAPYIQNGKKHRLIQAPAGDMEELIGYFEKFDFETGTYMRTGQPLRDGYSFKDYDEFETMVSQMREEAMKERAKANKSQFMSDISSIQFLPISGNRTTFEALGKDMNGGQTWNVAQVASYDQLATNIGKISACDNKLAVLVRATDYDNSIQGDYVVDRSETTFYLSVVNSDMKYEKIAVVGKDISVTKTNKHTIKVEQSGLLGTPTSISWNDHGDSFWVSGNKGSYTVNKETCVIN